MKLTGNVVLITGGATGIGYALAKKLREKENTVIICGRREQRLREAEQSIAGIITMVCDVSTASGREHLFQDVTREHPNVNVVINNAGIQRDIDFTTTNEGWDTLSSEIRINLDAPIHLSQLFIAHLRQQKDPAIIQVSSGLGFTPSARTPIYCATKAALHTFSATLRHQLRNTGIEVIEFIPPAVDSELNLESRVRRGFTKTGVTAEEFVDAMLAGIEQGQNEIGYGTTAKASQLSAEERDAIFARMNP